MVSERPRASSDVRIAVAPSPGERRDFVCDGELGANLPSVGMVQLVEDLQRLLPRLPGLGWLPGNFAGVAEAGEGFCFVEAVACFTEEAERVLVAGGGFSETAHAVLGVAQAVPDTSLKSAVAGFPAQGECLTAERTGLRVTGTATCSGEMSWTAIRDDLAPIRASGWLARLTPVQQSA